MDTSTSGGKRRLKDKMEREVAEEEEDENTEEDFELEDDRRKKVSGRRGSFGGGAPQPSCQVDNCTADLTYAKTYHKRHKVCEFHAKVPVAVITGFHQRFCQQCSRFHAVQEFDDTKRSCRRRLAGHNERRRKSSTESQGDGSA